MTTENEIIVEEEIPEEETKEITEPSPKQEKKSGALWFIIGITAVLMIILIVAYKRRKINSE